VAVGVRLKLPEQISSAAAGGGVLGDGWCMCACAVHTKWGILRTMGARKPQKGLPRALVLSRDSSEPETALAGTGGAWGTGAAAELLQEGTAQHVASGVFRAAVVMRPPAYCAPGGGLR
jgi:hypothetical protein